MSSENVELEIIDDDEIPLSPDANLKSKSSNIENGSHENGAKLKDSSKVTKLSDGQDSKSMLSRMSTKKRLQRFLHGGDAPPPMTLEFKNICARVPIAPGSNDKKLILNHISGIIRPGEFVALMGPSGAGKSTLLNTLGARFDGEHSGDILINNRQSSNFIKKYIGYVLQMDTLLPNLTVYETLEITASLRLSNSISKEKKKERIEDIIHIMGLNTCRNTMVQMCSGGEKKRISIANEMLINPSILFLDEPTSGLDSTSANSILNTLRELSNQGRTIICCIHQPSSQMFNKFDKLLLLSSANIIYFGKIDLVTNYLGSIGFKCPVHYNPADFILELTTDAFESENVELKNKSVINKALIRKWKEFKHNIIENENDIKEEEPIPNETNENNNNGKITNVSYGQVKSYSVIDTLDNGNDNIDSSSKWSTTWLEQFLILYRRAYIHRRGNNISKLKLFEIMMTALIAGLIWFQMAKKERNIQDWLGATFYIQIYLGFSTMYRGVVYFPMERNVIKKERQSKSYRLSSYYLSKALAEFPVDCILPLFAVTLFFWMVGISDKFVVFLAYVAITMLGIFTAGAFGTLLGTAFMDLERAITGLAIFGLLMMLLGGFFVKDSAIPIYMRWIGFFSFMRYTYGSNLLVITDTIKFKCSSEFSDFEECSTNRSNHVFKSSIRKVYYNNNSLSTLLVILLVQGIVWHILGYVALRLNSQIKHAKRLTNKEIIKGVVKQPWQTDDKTDENENDNNYINNDEKVSLKQHNSLDRNNINENNSDNDT